MCGRQTGWVGDWKGLLDWWNSNNPALPNGDAVGAAMTAPNLTPSPELAAVEAKLLAGQPLDARESEIVLEELERLRVAVRTLAKETA